ncbi:MAG TPA: ABC transporter substrate-binding protein [Stellaceae bacterium]|nr:ABC transporter substrate-binding protein [Stellaceae bacterium]
MKALALAVWVVAVLALDGAPAHADDNVTIGAIYRLTGAAADSDARTAIETAADIVNTPHQGLAALPLGAGQGLPSLGGAKIAATFGDDLGNVSVAQSQALRLIGREHVAALLGAGASPATLAASAVAERRGLPFLVPDADAPDITGRGFKWVFRTTPLAGDVVKTYARFLGELKQGGGGIDTVALVFENTAHGISAEAMLRDALKAAGFANVAEIGYPADATDLSPQIAQLRDKNPDAAIFIGHAADAIVAIKTMKTLNYKPTLLIGDDAGFADPGFVAAVGNLAQGALDRSVWSLGKPGSATAIVNALYKAKSGRDLDDGAARVMQGFFVLADAINRAGSTDPAAIRTALSETDLKPGQLIVGYDGVKFDATGQNTLGSTYLVQLQGKAYVAVWPAESAAGQLALPYKGWE